MPLYTKLNLTIDLDPDTPSDIIDILHFMIRGRVDEFLPPKPDHKLFDTNMWMYMLQSDTSKFPGPTHSRIERTYRNEPWHLLINCSLRDQNCEFEYLLDFLEPWCISDGLLGYILMDEGEIPDLIYAVDGRIIFYQVYVEPWFSLDKVI